MQFSFGVARRRPRAVFATGIAALMVLAAAGFAAADITGPDVSSHQHPNGASVDWSKVKDSGRNFAFVKSTEGGGYVNPYFTSDWSAIKANGMVRGSYHYARPDGSSTSAAEQARYFVSIAGKMQAAGDLAPVLDLEDTGGLSPARLASWVHSWLDTITQLTGRTPIIYTYPYFWRSAMGNNTGFTQYPLWIADYNGGSAPNTPLVGGWDHWTFWQYTDSGAIPGVSTGVDVSRFCCNSPALSALANGAPSAVTAPPSAILAHYTALGGSGSHLGQANGGEYAVPGGRAQNFTGGRVYSSAATGVHELHGAILAHYLAIGGPSSALGLPTTDESASADGQGRYNNFSSGGALYWSPTVGAHEVHGAIDDKWGMLGRESGVHGWPITDEQLATDRVGRYSDFQDGSVYWTPSTGAQSIHGAINEKYAQSQWEAGFLGYPLTDERSTPDGAGRYNHLQGGSIYWSPTTRAHSVQGAILGAWAAQGWERGTLGYPASDEHSVPGGSQSDFQGGSLFWNASTGAVTRR